MAIRMIYIFFLAASAALEQDAGNTDYNDDPVRLPADEYDESAPARFSKFVLMGAGGVDQNVSANGYLAVVENAAPHFRSWGPLGGNPCGKLSTTSHTAAAHRCRWAINGGPFNMSNGDCDAGFYVESGRVVGSGGWTSLVGVTSDGSWVAGTLDRSAIEKWRVNWAINGFSWLVKNGKVHAPLTPRSFFHAPRTAIGIDVHGRLMLLEVDGCEAFKGCPLHLGLTLHDMAKLLLAHGALHAINLDGGGSSVTVENGTVISHPTDDDDWTPRRERRVANIVCVM